MDAAIREAEAEFENGIDLLDAREALMSLKLLPKAYRDVEQIYSYISENLMVPNTAKNMVKLFEDEILNLEEFYSYLFLLYHRKFNAFLFRKIVF